MIPAYLVSIVAFAWGIAWILFARIHKAPALYWFCLPIFAVAGVYGYYALVEVPIETRAIIARAGILAVAMIQIVVLSVFMILERKLHER